MDFYGIGATSMAMSDVNMRYDAAMSLTKKSMEMVEMVMDTLLQGLEASMTGLGRYVDVQA